MQHRYGKKKARESSQEGSSTVDKPKERTSQGKQEKKEEPSSSGKSQDPLQGVSGQPDTFSINQALKKGKQSRQEQEMPADEEQEEETPADTGKDRREDFSQEQVEEALKSLAGNYREKPRVYNMLRSRKPEKKEEGVILIPLENHLQERQINKIYNTVLIHLKNSLQNDHISLRTQIMKDQTSNNKLYTAEDKYKYMEKKNQNLRQLRQDFDLDFD